MKTETPVAKKRTDYQSPDFTIESVELEFHLDETATLVESRMQVVRLNAKASTLTLDGEQLELERVSINGNVLAEHQYTLTEQSLTLLELGAESDITIVTRINPTANKALEGLYRSGEAFCTQCEAEGFRRITYYLDRPDVLAKYTVKIVGDKARYPYLLSNGNLIERGDLEQGKHYAVWQDPFPKPSYLFALVAGDFDRLEDVFETQSGRQVDLHLYVDKGNLPRAEHAMASLKRSMKWDEEVYGLEYDLDIYMIVAVDFFNMGAMENKGLNVFNSKYVLADVASATDDDYVAIESVIGHEYFHNWTGNRVTCRDWFQLSLKEGLTVFRDQTFSQDMTGSAVSRIDDVNIIRTHQFAEDAGPMAHPIRPEEVIEMNNFYTVTVYNKGAEVIRMMHTLLGQEGFRKGMDRYFEKNDGKAVTCDDFVDAMEQANNVDFGVFRRWYSQSGTPTLQVKDSYDEQQGVYRLEFTQQLPDDPAGNEKSPQHIPIALSFYQPDGELLQLSDSGDQLVISLQDWQGVIELDLDFKPVPSLLEGFSAPVKLDYAYSTEQLLVLLANCNDGFMRWNAGQILLSRCIDEAMANEQWQMPEHVTHGFVAVMLDDALDNALKARVVSMPSISGLIEERGSVAITALLDAYERVNKQLCHAVSDEALALYGVCKEATYSPAAESIAKRQLKNRCLAILAESAPELANKLAEQQFNAADNMTDTLAAVSIASQNALPVAEPLLAAFEQQWKHDTLVMDKWFSVQARREHDQALATIRELLAHEVFSLENPNKVRALIGTFAAANYRQFHREDGEGYRLLADMVEKLNAINPQVAARVITPLTHWKKFLGENRVLMKAQLERLSQLPDLKKDLQEIIGKALG